MKPRAWIAFLFYCGAAIFGVRAFFIERYGASVPLVHEWEATGLDTLAAWHEGTYTLAALFEPHNGDHPTVFTRLWEILWFEVNGSWDPKLVMTTKAVVFALAAVIFIHLLVGGVERGRFTAAAVLAALFAFPFNWHNLLWGVASQFDFFFLAAALGWLALQKQRPRLALLVAVLALFTNGAGPIVALSYLVFFAVAGLRREWSWREALVHSFIALAIAGFGLAMHTSTAEPHVGTLADKGITLARLYAWPFGTGLALLERLPESARFFPRALLAFPTAEGSWLIRAGAWLQAHPIALAALYGVLALFLQAPVVALLRAWREKRIGWPLVAGPLGVGVFAGLMLAATAAARAGQTTIAVRYLDHVALAGFCAIAAAFVVAARSARARRWNCVWGVLLALGYAGSVGVAFSQLNRGYPTACLELMQRYFATRDRAILTKDEVYRDIVYDATPDAFIAMLNERRLQPVLPRAVVAPGEPLRAPAAAAALVRRASPLLVLGAFIGAWWIVRRGARPSDVRDRGLAATAKA